MSAKINLEKARKAKVEVFAERKKSKKILDKIREQNDIIEEDDEIIVKPKKVIK